MNYLKPFRKYVEIEAVKDSRNISLAGNDLKAVIDAMKADADTDLRTLNVDGGASANDFLMQFQADMLDKPVNRPACVESTALGAAYLAGLAVGYWESKEEVMKNVQYDRVFIPSIDPEERETKRKGWNKAVRYAFGWARQEEEEE